MRIGDADYAELLETRWRDPEAVARKLAARRRRESFGDSLLIVAADHPARGMLGIGSDALAMASRRGLLERLAVALAHPGVDGVLGSADVLEDLAFLDLLDGKLAFGTMNRGGLAGASWELDDRFTAYDAEHVARAGLDGGKMLLRIDDDDAGTIPTLDACARAVTELADRGLVAMVEPLAYTKDERGRAVVDERPERLVRAIGVASALGATSSRTWLKIPASADVETALAATTLPVLLLGGARGPDPAALFERWRRALELPNARGLVVGRVLLYPEDGDVERAVEAAAELVASAGVRR